MIIQEISWFFVGFCIGFIVDILWWIYPAFKKAEIEKTIEIFEKAHTKFG